MSELGHPGTRARNLRVGALLVLGVGVVIALVFVLGGSESLFRRRAHLHTSFENISGLVAGAPVRLAGVDVGVVESIRFDPNPREKRVKVNLAVDRAYLDRIRDDSVARLASKGLLGDMIINITVGSADAKPIETGAYVRSQETEGLTEVVTSVQDAIGEVRALAVHVDERLRAVLSDDLSRDLSRLARSSADVVEKVQKGDGLLHGLVYDPKLARNVEQLVADGRDAASVLDGALRRVDRLLAVVEKGDGSAHSLLYRDDLGQALIEARRAARELADVAAAVRSGDGLAHTVVYERDRSDLVANLTRLSRALGQVGDDLAAGRGTVGALLKDPSVYEDLKTILGNVQRSLILRELVRYTIRKDGISAPASPPPARPVPARARPAILPSR